MKFAEFQTGLPIEAGPCPLTLRATVIARRRSLSKPTLGILRWGWQLFNDWHREALDLEAARLFELPV